MSHWVARHRKALTIAGLGLLEVAAYVIADPGELPDWVVTLAAVVNVLGVYLAPRNAQPVSREDLKRKVDYYSQPTTHARRARSGEDPRSALPRTRNSATEDEPPVP